MGLEVLLHLSNIQYISLPTSPLSALSSDDELHENGYLTLHQMPNLLYVRSLNHSLTARNISEGCPPLQAVMAKLVSLPWNQRPTKLTCSARYSVASTANPSRRTIHLPGLASANSFTFCIFHNSPSQVVFSGCTIPVVSFRCMYFTASTRSTSRARRNEVTNPSLWRTRIIHLLGSQLIMDGPERKSWGKVCCVQGISGNSNRKQYWADMLNMMLDQPRKFQCVERTHEVVVPFTTRQKR